MGFYRGEWKRKWKLLYYRVILICDILSTSHADRYTITVEGFGLLQGPR